MPYRITKEHVWVGVLDDRTDALAEKLRALSSGGLNLELILARRDAPGRALVFISPLRTLEQITVAEKAGLGRQHNLRVIRVEGENVPGLGAKITTALSQAGINLYGYWAASLGDRSVTNIAVESDEDGNKAKAVLDKLLGT